MDNDGDCNCCKYPEYRRRKQIHNSCDPDNMTNPENTGMVKLSLNGIGDNSMSIAANPPRISISASIFFMIGRITAKDKIIPIGGINAE